MSLNGRLIYVLTVLEVTPFRSNLKETVDAFVFNYNVFVRFWSWRKHRKWEKPLNIFWDIVLLRLDITGNSSGQGETAFF